MVLGPVWEDRAMVKPGNAGTEFSSAVDDLG